MERRQLERERGDRERETVSGKNFFFCTGWLLLLYAFLLLCLSEMVIFSALYNCVDYICGMKKQPRSGQRERQLEREVSVACE
jgi:hypothetical protein